jgi:hypothetical protein
VASPDLPVLSDALHMRGTCTYPHPYIHIGTFRLLANLSNIFFLGVIEITIFTMDFP